tara:strand:+ start:286 stop:1974 length:1689 start_codon:yes stop_codon:yes gene_type:complete
MRWKILSFSLLAALVGIVWGTFMHPKLPTYIAYAEGITSGKARIGVAPRIISYQGYLKDSSSGQAVSNDSRTAVFSLYTSDSGGSAVWQETKTIVTSNGVFRTILGQTSPINPSIVAVPELWLGVRLPPDAEMTPRQRITGSVYSVGATEAQVADTVSVSPEQIANRKWYGLNRSTPPRLDIAWGLLKMMGDTSNGFLDTPSNSTTSVVAFSASSITEDPFNAETYPEPSIFQPVSALGSMQSRWGIKSVLFSIGNELMNTTGSQDGTINFHQYLGAQCHSMTSLEVALVCATGSELIITQGFEPNFLRSTSLPTYVYSHRNILCPGCRFTAFDGENLWATSYDNGEVHKIPMPLIYEEGATSSVSHTSSYSSERGRAYPYPKNPEINSTYAVGNNPVGVEFDGTKVWVVNEADDTVSVLNASTGASVGTVSVGDLPSKVLFDGSSVWVLNKGDETVTKIDSESLSVIGTFTGGDGPVDISFDGYHLWIANQDDNTITRLRTTDGSEVDVLDLPGSPYLLQFDGQGTWIATKEIQPTVLHTPEPGYGSSWSLTGERWFLTRY